MHYCTLSTTVEFKKPKRTRVFNRPKTVKWAACFKIMSRKFLAAITTTTICIVAAKTRTKTRTVHQVSGLRIRTGFELHIMLLQLQKVLRVAFKAQTVVKCYAELHT